MYMHMYIYIYIFTRTPYMSQTHRHILCHTPHTTFIDRGKSRLDMSHLEAELREPYLIFEVCWILVRCWSRSVCICLFVSIKMMPITRSLLIQSINQSINHPTTDDRT